MKDSQHTNVYITTPIFYVNDVPHFGHAYTNVVADVLARHYAMLNYNVRSQTGTDEHGQKVFLSAVKNKQSTMSFCTQNSNRFWELSVDLNCCASYKSFDIRENFEQFLTTQKIKNHKMPLSTTEDVTMLNNSLFANGKNFIRTTEGRSLESGDITESSYKTGRHMKAVHAFWNRLKKNGWLYKDLYQGWYSVADEAFYGQEEIVDGKAPTGATVEWREEESYFFKLSEFQEFIIQLYKQNHLIIPVEKRSEVLSFVGGLTAKQVMQGDFVKGHLKDLCVSRTTVEWGIPVPNEENHKVYVWLDALVNYISALEYPSNHAEEYFQNAKTIHVLGKDILRFHSIYWSSFLIAEHFSVEEFRSKCEKMHEFVLECNKIVPKQLLVHGWWTNEGVKMSKSLGNVVAPHLEIKRIEDSFNTTQAKATDYLRYFMIRAMQIGEDGNYDPSQLHSVVESDLCNNIGNLLHRTLSMVRSAGKWDDLFEYKLYSSNSSLVSIVNDFPSNEISNAIFAFFENVCKDLSSGKIKSHLAYEYSNLVEEAKMHEIVLIAVEIGLKCNKFIAEMAPWKLKKDNIADFYAVMQVVYVSIVFSLQLLYPFMPYVISKIFNYLGIDFAQRQFINVIEKTLHDNAIESKVKSDSLHSRVSDDTYQILRLKSLDMLLKELRPNASILKLNDDETGVCGNELPIFFPKLVK